MLNSRARNSIARSTQNSETDARRLHVLNRLGFGPRPGDIESVRSIGVETYIKSQLASESIPESPKITRELAKLETLSMSPVELYQRYGRIGKKLSEKERQQKRKDRQEVARQAVRARLMRALHAEGQLQEVMVDFWFNHFNVFAGKGLTRIWVGAYEREAIRPHALGNFRNLLAATARHPAMLFYLDNWQNTAPGSPGAKGRLKGLNENYARELMELHTLGVDGGYTQEDVIALARILTGWGLANRGREKDESGFYFNSKRHDFNDKVFLGTSIEGSGESEVERVLDILASHPACARHVSYKLARYFVADDPPSRLVDALAGRFLETNGNIRALLETLFFSSEFLDPKYYGNKFKTPYQYVISIARAIGVENFNPDTASGMLRDLSMPVYGCPTPNGYQNSMSAWLSPDAMLRRVSFATVMADKGDVESLKQTFGNNFSQHTRKQVESSPPKLQSSLILGSPEVMYR